ncbi:DUF6817 domain-containing protein [Georgenia sp. 311]|uniref:DUF6817 domain-containing protein n=1 Tax=Georgenia sp. 311 TaxID=2585134 RepID=UPI00159B8DFB|nr:hypothetical protein [Georgenia sp. 311]
MTFHSRVAAAEDLLRARGAAEVPHPGGTLLDHLRRVRIELAAWDAPPEVQLAGLCHASYGTDGFDTALLDLAERPVLTEAIGAEAESLVYLYGSCVRAHVYPQLGQEEVEFVDRFTDVLRTPDRASLSAFMEITAANELDVVRHNPAIAAEHGPALHELVVRASRHLSDKARRAWTDQAARTGVAAE